MPGPLITLTALALSLAWALLLHAGVLPSDWVSTVLFVGCICLLYWFFVRRRLLAPPDTGWVKRAIWSVPAYCIFQLLPLPLGLLGALSPARSQMVAALAAVMATPIGSAPIAANPPMALYWSFTLLSYIATFFLVRELAWRFIERPWITVVPLIALGFVEGIFGMIQALSGGANALADGTFTNPDHFSGMLEMLLPLAVMFGWGILQRERDRVEQSVRPALEVVAVWATAGLLLMAIVYSQSHMGLFVAISSLFVTAALSFGPRLPSKNLRTAALTAIALGGLALFIFLPPDQLLGRFAEMSASGKVSADMRVYLWKETLSLIGEFRWFGCGLGGFEPTFLKYQATGAGFRVEFAHNDYLQYLVELGFVGFAILMTAIVGVLIPVVKGIVRGEDENRRLLLVGCAGSFLAIGLHSLVDFNLYIPANGMILAWIAGVASINGLD
jgi:O-antigen ligase